MIISESINFLFQQGYINKTNKSQKIKIETMEEKIINLTVSLGLMLAYLEKEIYYDKLLKNEGNDKYIISIVNIMTEEEIVDVFRVSEIKDPELRSRTPLLDDGYPLIHTCDDGEHVFSYLSEVKLLSETVMESVSEIFKNM
jgi:hypothetical protein